MRVLRETPYNGRRKSDRTSLLQRIAADGTRLFQNVASESEGRSCPFDIFWHVRVFIVLFAGHQTGRQLITIHLRSQSYQRMRSALKKGKPRNGKPPENCAFSLDATNWLTGDDDTKSVPENFGDILQFDFSFCWRLRCAALVCV
jgi:hypothetical protein